MRVIVTGATGFIGCNLAEDLHRGGTEVIATGRSRAAFPSRTEDARTRGVDTECQATLDGEVNPRPTRRPGLVASSRGLGEDHTPHSGMDEPAQFDYYRSFRLEQKPLEATLSVSWWQLRLTTASPEAGSD